MAYTLSKKCVAIKKVNFISIYEKDFKFRIRALVDPKKLEIIRNLLNNYLFLITKSIEEEDKE